MAVRVVTMRYGDGSVGPSEIYQDGGKFYVTAGHLFVTTRAGDIQGAYVPEKWVSVHVEGASTVEQP